MKILLSNDDGFHAPGLKALYNGLAADHQVQVVAPDRDRSGASSALTLARPLRPITLDNGFIGLDGTPADCVHLALTHLLDWCPDIVIAGINAGSNLGDDVLYSGTVGAALEGRWLTYPPVAVSLAGREQIHYETAVVMVKRLLAIAPGLNLPQGTLLNLNVPDLPVEDIAGLQVTRLGSRGQSEAAVKMLDPRERDIFWMGPASDAQDASIGTDFCAVHQGYVSITPIQLDMTHYGCFDQLSQQLNQ
jgi:5'-nucleotidase